METDSRVTRHSNLMEFFKGKVDKAVKRNRFKADKMLCYYIVNLMTEYSRTDYYYSADQEDTLVAALNKAMNSENPKKIAQYKMLGDYTLFISGFFHDCLSTSLIDINYYILIGKMAYSNLATAYMGGQKKFFKKFYRELSDKFKDMTEILAEVSDKTNICTNQDVLRIYERWLKTGSERERHLLKSKGVIPIHSSGALTLN